MRIVIEDNMNFAEVQAQFTSSFPFLKLKPLTISDRPDLSHNAGAAATPVQKGKEAAFSLNYIDGIENMPVWAMEELLSLRMGMGVKIFRRAGNVWLETSMTHDWSLKRQNEHGREMTLYPLQVILPPHQ